MTEGIENPVAELVELQQQTVAPARGPDKDVQVSISGSAAGPTGIGIAIEGLTKTYERISRTEIIRTHALNGVDLTVKANDFVSLIGPSGCGKTTVLKIIAGLLRPTAGQVRIGDKVVKGPGTDRATVFQSPGLMPWKNVIDNVVLALDFAGVPRNERTGRAKKYIELVGLKNFHDHYPAELSGGMQQRVGIARALAIEPNALLMDEPFGALDALTRGQMQSELLRIWDHEKRTVVFVTHSIDEAILLSDRILVMNEGVITDEVEVTIQRPRARELLMEDETALGLKRQLMTLIK